MARSPEQAVREHIARARAASSVRESTLAAVGGGVERVPRPGIRAGGTPWTADLDTVEILEERRILGRHVYVVSFEADHDRAGRVPMTMVVRAERVTGLGWVARGIGAVAGGAEPAVAEPRVLLGGSWGRFGFCGGGRLCGPSAAVESVRLRFGNGIELEDDAETGWVVFFTDEPVERPDAIVELLDATGAVVATHEWPPRPDLADELRRRIPRG